MTDETQGNSETPPKNGAAINWPSLILGIFIMMGISVYPFALADKFGKVNHSTLMFLMWAMTAGIVRGVGFIPENKILKYMLSAAAAYVCFAIFILFTFIQNGYL